MKLFNKCRTKIEQAKSTSQSDIYPETNLSEDVSPQMKAAIQYLQSKRGAKEDQHSRPKDQNNYGNDNQIANVRKDETKHNNIAYNVHFFPLNTKLV